MSPRYIEVADDIRSEIRSGQTPVGSFLPSEPVLAERMGVSRTTIRAALSHLQRLGIVTRRRGAGTRIEAEEAAPLYVHSMVASGDQLQFAGPTTRHVHVIEEIVADEELAPRLDNRPGRRWLRIGQTRHVADNPTPVCWTDVYVAQKYAAIGDEIRDYPRLVYTLLEARYGVVITRIDQSLRAIGLPQDYAGVLEAPADSHALELTRRYRDSEQKCEIVSLSFLPSGRFTYDLTLVRVASAAEA